MSRLSFAGPLMITALLAAPAGAAPAPGNQGKTWADIAKLPPLNGIYETARMSRGTPGNRPRIPFTAWPTGAMKITCLPSFLLSSRTCSSIRLKYGS